MTERPARLGLLYASALLVVLVIVFVAAKLFLNPPAR